MSKTVYIEITDSYSRTVWDSTGVTNYLIGDRVEYNDGSRNIIFVCIADNNSTTNPDTNTSDWVEAGSEEYPFLVLDGPNNMGGVTNSEWSWYGNSSEDKNFLVESIGSWTQDEATNYWSASAPGATIILGDGRYAWTHSTFTMWLPSGANIVAKNKGKAYLITNSPDWGGGDINLKALVIYSSDTWSTFPGCHDGKFNMYSCLITQETPWETLFPLKQVSSDNRQARPSQNWKGGTIKNCTFDYSYRGPSYWFVNSPDGLVENNTFYCRVKHNQYNLFYAENNVVFKNNIFYIKELYDALTDQDLTTKPIATEGENIIYIENKLSTSGGSIINNTDFQEINPLLIDADSGNFELRPSSPLIGGVDDGLNKLSKKHPNGVWVDHNHSAVYNNYNYSITGDGTDYTFTGDISGTDPTINASTKETLTFNNTGGHPLAIYNSQGELVASESSGVTTFTPKYPDTYYYQCTVDGHENMRGDIVITNGTLGSYDNPFTGYYDAIDAGYYDDTLTILFKTGDHELYHQVAGGTNNTQISSAFPGGLYFIGEDPNTTRLTTGSGSIVGYAAFYINSGLDTGKQFATPLYLENLGIHVNNSSSYIMRGVFSCVHWKSSSLTNCRITQEPSSQIRCATIDYHASSAPSGFSLTLKGCEMITAQQQGSFILSGTVTTLAESCTFIVPSSSLYNYSQFGTIEYLFYNVFTSESKIKNCIFYSDAGGEIASSSKVLLDVFSNCCFHSTTDSFSSYKIYGNANDINLSNTMVDPDFLDLAQAGNENIKLRPTSALIGGIKTTETNVYYLQPGNLYNGDGSQKDASGMSADGDPGPFNEFKEIVAAGVPYGSKIIILNGTYDWTLSFGRNPSTNVSVSTWYAYTLAGYNYVAETMHEVIFDAKLDPSNVFIYKPYSGPVPGPSTGAFADLDTTFTGIQFNNMAAVDSTTRNMISSVSGSAGQGSCTFKNCKFLGHINTGLNYDHPWTGGPRLEHASAMHWENCEISIAFDNAGGLLCGEDRMANDVYHGAWSWKNCTFYIATGMTTFNGRNAANGTYVSPSVIFGHNYDQSQRLFKNNIIQIQNGTATIGVSSSAYLPNIENNSLNGVDPVHSGTDHSEILNAKNNLFGVDPKFIDPANSNFQLRPNSTLIGKGK